MVCKNFFFIHFHFNLALSCSLLYVFLDLFSLLLVFLLLGLKVLIGPKALMSIIGTEMDFVKDKASSGFVFNNPNVKGTCGCGESFNFTPEEATVSAARN
jgi:hypothetical protein